VTDARLARTANERRVVCAPNCFSLEFEIMLRWQWSSFEGLSRYELHEILKVRQAVFVVEQNCVYQDIDDLDPEAWHLTGWLQDEAGETLAAYLRVVFPGRKYSEPSLGRVLTARSVRGTGLGRELLREGISRTLAAYPGTSIRISAQQYLEQFYSEFGFETVSDAYQEDGIPHLEMLRRSSQ
jgi:ElaA protein